MKKAGAHTMLPGQWDRSGYAQAIESDGEARATFSSPHLKNAGTYLFQARNWFEAMEVSYRNDPDEIRLVMASYGPMNFITYNSSMWAKYLQILPASQRPDPAPAVNPHLGTISGLQARHAVFLV